MPIDLTPIDGGNKKRIPLEDISPDVIEAVDAAYLYCQESDKRLEADLKSKEAAEAFLHEARSYAYQHEPRYVVTGNPTAKGLARFRVELYQAPAETEAA